MKKLLTILAFLPLVLAAQTVGINNNEIQVTQSQFIVNSDSIFMHGAIAQFHRMDSIDVSAANVWVTVKWDTVIPLETTYGYKFNSDSTGIICTRSCDTRVQGCGHWNWRGANNSTVKMYIRVLVNSDEARCLQSNDTRGRQTSDDGTMPYTGTIHHNIGDVIYVQYRVTNVSMDWEGAAIFDNPVAFSVNFECINSH